METVKITFESAGDADAAAVAAVRLAAARDLTARFGTGTWSFALESESAVRAELRSSLIVIARHEGSILGTLRLSTRNPWIGDISFFTRCDRPLYLTSMAISPKWQRQGVGRMLLDEARRVAWVDLNGEAIRLDCYDAPAGAGEFYLKCGFRAMRRGLYNGTPLIWCEQLLARAAP